MLLTPTETPTPQAPPAPAPSPQAPSLAAATAAAATLDADSDDIWLVASGPPDTGLTDPSTSGSHQEQVTSSSQVQADGSPIAAYGGGGSDRAEEDYEEYQGDITGIVLGLCGGGSSDAESPTPDAPAGYPAVQMGKGEGKGKGQDS